MKKSKVKTANAVCKGVIIGLAAMIAIGALRYNPCHLFTAAIVFAFGLECEPFNEKDYDIC